MTVATTLFRFDDSYAREVPGLSVPWTAAPAPAPELLVLNEELAVELGVDSAALREPSGVALLAGQAPEGVMTVAQAYAGHQFGIYVPRLGDGRALLLGEVIDTQGRRHDLHLKGSGRTPFARGGDGKAVVSPMLREYLVGEAMHGLGIPTTRALAVVATGERVRRERALPGAVLTRVAASHLRVGTFQYAAASGDRDLLRALADHAIARHHPQAADAPNRYLDLYRRVVQAQASLVAWWMLAGFVHGVMNTDNTTISGETIDYGPCAFMDAFDPATVFSSIDHHGRYAYGNQPAICRRSTSRGSSARSPPAPRGRCSPSRGPSMPGPPAARFCCPRTGPRWPPRWTGSTPSTSRAITASRRRLRRRPLARWGRSTVSSRSSPDPSRSGPAWRTTPARRRRAAPRTSPTAAPEHGFDGAET